MREFQTFGTYYRTNGHLCRKAAYLQFGHCNKSIGSTIMLNPGKADFKDNIHVLDDQEVSGEIVPDKTMLRLAEILHQSSKMPLDGRFHIYNLFSLQNTSSKEAVKQDSYLNEAILKNIAIINQFQSEQHPWVLLAWSTERNATLQKLKEPWIQAIKQSKTKVFGIRADGKHMFYHPYPRIKTHKERYLQEIVDQLRNDKFCLL